MDLKGIIEKLSRSLHALNARVKHLESIKISPRGYAELHISSEQSQAGIDTDDTEITIFDVQGEFRRATANTTTDEIASTEEVENTYLVGFSGTAVTSGNTELTIIVDIDSVNTHVKTTVTTSASTKYSISASGIVRLIDTNVLTLVMHTAAALGNTVTFYDLTFYMVKVS